jgi:phage terminase large subunit-like protein
MILEEGAALMIFRDEESSCAVGLVWRTAIVELGSVARTHPLECVVVGIQPPRKTSNHSDQENSWSVVGREENGNVVARLLPRVSGKGVAGRFHAGLVGNGAQLVVD